MYFCYFGIANSQQEYPAKNSMPCNLITKSSPDSISEIPASGKMTVLRLSVLPEWCHGRQILCLRSVFKLACPDMNFNVL